MSYNCTTRRLIRRIIRACGVRGNFKRIDHSPVVGWLNKGLTSVGNSPTDVLAEEISGRIDHSPVASWLVDDKLAQ
eukprot:5718555-Pyramimonas_sp.AAC.1